MSQRSRESRGGLVNEELRDYEGFPAILSLLERTATDLEDQLQPQPSVVDEVRAAVIPITEEERAAHELLISAISARPDVADLLQRLQVNEELRSRIVSDLFRLRGIESPEQEQRLCRRGICGGEGATGSTSCRRA
jgi:hypothetical protein